MDNSGQVYGAGYRHRAALDCSDLDSGAVIFGGDGACNPPDFADAGHLTGVA
jgi:hypothetical protein